MGFLRTNMALIFFITISSWVFKFKTSYKHTGGIQNETKKRFPNSQNDISVAWSSAGMMHKCTLCWNYVPGFLSVFDSQTSDAKFTSYELFYEAKIMMSYWNKTAVAFCLFARCVKSMWQFSGNEDGITVHRMANPNTTQRRRSYTEVS